MHHVPTRFTGSDVLLAATANLTQLRPYYSNESRDLLRVLLSATSATEANLALQVLLETVPARSLVHACNLREVLRALPSTPIAMRVDEQTLARTAGLERGIAVMSKTLPDEIELAITTAGNLVLDIIVRHLGEKHFWNPIPITDDNVTSEVVDLCVNSEYLLDAVIDLAKSMGVVFNPKFYLSLEDWFFDNAADAFGGIGDLF
jgi:hypothetical protein